jgi:hypothetical protein
MFWAAIFISPVLDLYAMLSLRHFRLARSRSLSLGARAPRRARRIDREHDPRRRPFRFRKNRRCSTGASRAREGERRQ